MKIWTTLKMNFPSQMVLVLPAALSPISPTLWPIDPHTLAKHEILVEYLKAWFPILSSSAGRIIYLDGFAGPGIYAGGEPGSPVLALQTASEHSLRERFREIRFVFIEKRSDRAQKLTEILSERFPGLPQQLKYEVLGAEFAPTLESVLNQLEAEEASLAPTFAFLDPFGFSGLPMSLITRMLEYRMCEVLVTFMTGFVNRFNDELREEALDELYATPEWRQVRELTDPDERRDFLIRLYTGQVREVAGVRYVRPFAMHRQDGQLLYHLVYATKHLKGLQVMKRAMYHVDRRGTYRFSDATDPGQAFLIDYQDDSVWLPQAAEMVYDKFRGTTCGLQEIEEFVLAETPFRFMKKILKPLEKSGRIDVSGRIRRFTYPDGCNITFQ